MKKHFITILLALIIVFHYPALASQTQDYNSKDIYIHQISPHITSCIKTTYSLKTNEGTTDKVDPVNDLDNTGYMILTTKDIADEIKLSSFISWKQSLGYTIRIVNITDSFIQEQEGNDLAEKIRNFLRGYYSVWQITSLLIIGDINTIPMRYCYPNPQNHRFNIFDYTSGEVPTDYYYADLSTSDEESWDLDGDGFYGEYSQDQPDFLAEIMVGRIPINDVSRIMYTLEKTVTYEQDTSSWKQHALHAGAFFYFTEESPGHPAMDGAVLSYHIEEDIMDGWTISHYSEQEGIESSLYNWPALSQQSFINDWENNKYSIVNWQGHGWTDRVARKVWVNDNGDNIPQSNEINWPNFITRSITLEDDYPSIITAVSCYVGCPEPDPNAIGNLGIDLLTHPSFGAGVAVVASARSPYGSSDWPHTPGGSDQIIYEFNKNLITQEETVGEALYHSKYFCNSEYGWDNYAENIDMFTFNLFGDPTLKLKRIVGNQPPSKPIITGPSSGKIRTEYTFQVTSTDPEGDQIRYLFDWGEELSSWTEPFASGKTINSSYTWSKKGDYEVRVKAKDSHNKESEWSDPFPVSMPKTKFIVSFSNLANKNPILYRTLSLFFRFYCTNIYWYIYAHIPETVDFL